MPSTHAPAASTPSPVLFEALAALGSSADDPFIPADAPFSPEQRVWLAGFLAGVRSSAIDATDAGGRTPQLALHVLVGTQTGTAEAIAEDLGRAASGYGVAVTTIGLDDVEVDRLPTMGHVVVITSTYGEGEMPDNAELFWETLQASTAPRLDGLKFSVLALGDSGYDGFCQAGKLIDTRLEQLGAERILARVDCDVDYEEPAAAWTTQALSLFGALAPTDADAAPAPAPAAKPAKKPGRTRSPWTRKTPYGATLAVNRVLSGPASSKEIRHYEFDLGDSGIEYAAGDALGVMPSNDPALVDAIIAELDATADESVDGSTLADRLTHGFEIRTPSKDLVAELADRAPDSELAGILALAQAETLDSWLRDRDILDLLRSTAVRFDAAALLDVLRPLQHRAYSISSSPLAADGRVHLTVASVRYAVGDRLHGGVASTHLADRVAEGATSGIFVSANAGFRVPSDDDAPLIMVGPGTGIAPFRSFLQERRERGATGRNWLFFGDQHRAHDFIYEDELGELLTGGVLDRLDLAFSRDQREKVYVQTRMRENGKELYAWLEEGGHFAVCGDASRMAKDVDQALHELIAEHGGRSTEAAAEYVHTLKREKRYIRDVY
ncbi:sulfite reductase subunit alpha [Plantibacter sp. CFBP 13570]|uniref:sulfite reductase subunit alpha n=1 Tax=Plantibacter sp. CFBP 13570 TaxID=2775272 RepID=UPI001930D1B1|nr:sulfite reductase subunit alpha [Plantibacter sp. CFBP 13570]MBD8533829.1 sulfite reductase subunit alpha [Plantibacter sp. CFBP 13570]